MKQISRILIVFLTLIMINPQDSFGVKGPFDKEWSQVESFEKKGLWKSALDKTLEIGAKARAQKLDAELLKTLVYRIRYSQRLQEFSELAGIELMEAELKQASYPVDAVIQSMLAEKYMAYLSDNRWELMERVHVLSKSDAPVTEWSIAQLQKRIFDLCRFSVSENNKLQQVKISQWSPVVVPGENTALLRPTLYDLLAHRAIEILNQMDQEGIEPATTDHFSHTVYLSNFREYRLYDGDKDLVSKSADVFVHELYRRLITFHAFDTDPAALIDVDLQRLRWVLAGSKQANREQLYLNALEFLKDAYSGSAATAEVAYASASFLYDLGLQYRPNIAEDKRWYIKRAKEVLESALQVHPRSTADTRIRQLLDNIVRKDLGIQAEEAVLPNTWFKVLLKYQNTDKVYLRIIPNERKDEQLDENLGTVKNMDYFSRANPIREWAVELPVDGDFQSHSLEIPIKGLEPGEYILLASASPKFESSANGIAVVQLNASVLSYTSRNTTDGRMEIMVLHRNTGKPLRKVNVDLYSVDYEPSLRAYRSVRSSSYVTDNDGYLFLNDIKNARDFYLVIQKEKSKLRTSRISTYNYSQEENAEQIRHWFFTDRAIYRPGQTLMFKMIAASDSAGKHELQINKAVRIYLRDANYSLIDSLELKTNAYGSVSGSFRLPASTLNGELGIYSEFGQSSFNVESYKRPTFEVIADSLQGIAELNKSMNVSLKAKTYSGLPMGLSEFTWELSRREFWDDPWMMRGKISHPYRGGDVIARGKGLTSDDGRFEISFIPWSVSNTLEEGESYMFELDVHVTDGSGESHNLSKTYRINKTGVETSVALENRIDKDKAFSFELKAVNAEGSPIDAVGEVKVIRLDTPSSILKKRLWERPDKFIMTRQDHFRVFPNDIFDNEDDVKSFQTLEVIWAGDFDSRSTSTIAPGLQKSKSTADISSWPTGMYKVEAKGMANDGRELTWNQVFTVYSARERELPVKSFVWTELLTPSVVVGDTAVFLVGTSDQDAQVYCEITCRGESINRKWILLNQEQRKVEIPIDHSMKGGFFLDLFMVKQNRFYREQLDIDVPFSDKKLDIEWLTFRDKMEPGKQENIVISINGLSENELAEFMAGMYDASLDAYTPHFWNFNLYPANVRKILWNGEDRFGSGYSFLFQNKWNPEYIPKNPDPARVYPNFIGSGYMYGGRIVMNEMALSSMPPGGAKMKNDESLQVMADSASEPEAAEGKTPKPTGEAGLRSNLKETAFFFPQMLSDKKGNVTLNFTAPDAVTRWKLMTMAHTSDLRFGMKEYVLQTQKKLVVKPNLPRFLRQGDKITITARVSSTVDTLLTGNVVLSLRNPNTGEVIDKLFGNLQNTKPFKLNGIETRVISWDIVVPAGIDEVALRIMASSGKISDGEETHLVILVNRELLTESKRFYLTESGSVSMNFEAMDKVMKNPGTARPVAMNVEFDANPLWQVVKALPYLMEFPHQCMEQEFARFFANATSAMILNANPDMGAVVKSWGEEGNLSELEKNPDLKSLKLENSPWVYAAESERKQRGRLGLLLDKDRVSEESASLAQKLINGQLSNGGWPWFPGMPDNEYITSHILNGLARMRAMGSFDVLDNSVALQHTMINALRYLDQRMVEKWSRLKREKLEWIPGSYEMNYLYCRALMHSTLTAEGKTAEVWTELLYLCKTKWAGLEINHQARLGSVFRLLGMQKEAQAILASLRETAIHSDELGTFWKNSDGQRIHGESIIETQAQIIQFFMDMDVSGSELQQMRRRLLTDKQVNAWESTKATTEACFVLLDKNTLSPSRADETKLLVGGKQVINEGKLAATGYLSKSWTASELNPAMSRIEISKSKSGLSWGAAYFQYTEEIDKAPAGNSGMNLQRVVLKEQNPGEWTVYDQATECKPGDKIKVRLIMSLDRDMEFLHLKDLRAAGLEPGIAMSGYRYDNGLGYYRSITDQSMDFFFAWLSAGTHILEYDLYAAFSGDFSNGFSEIESMYAPAFRARTVGGRLRLK